MPLINRILAATLAGLICSQAWANEVTVSAAASLTQAFKEVAQSYEAIHPETRILLNFGASGALLQQMTQGAPVDVLASADQDTMDQAEQRGLIVRNGRRDFARNSLVVVVPTDSALHIKTLSDLTQAGVRRVAIGHPASVPVGRYAQQALEADQLWTAVQAKSVHTQNVRQSLDYVARGEVEAAFVYATDAAIMKGKVDVAFNVPLKRGISYPIAVSVNSAHAKEARGFMSYVLSPPGQEILRKHGFLKS